MTDPLRHTVAAVVPVYRGAKSLPGLVEELLRCGSAGARTPQGRPFEIVEIVLVYDNGPDQSDEVIRQLVRDVPQVRGVWLARNFGQHPATMAGMASTTADWIVTLDEDGQHDPADIPAMLDTALDTRSPLVYGKPTNKPPHPWYRNATSKLAKSIANNLLITGGLGDYSSYRLVVGEIGRSLAAYSGPGTYLDAALSWIVPKTATCPVTLRVEEDRPSGYHLRSLASHFWRLVLTSGTRPLRVVSWVGLIFAILGLGFASWAVIQKFTHSVPIAGWTSLTVITLLGFGVLLVSLGVIAEYVGVGVRMAMGRPAYLITSDPAAGPLGRGGLPADGARDAG